MEKLLFFTEKDWESASFEDWIAGKPEAYRPMANELWKTIQSCGNDVQGIFHDGHPIACVQNAPFTYINVFSKHMNLGFFYGVELEDSTGMLQGTGKRMRHIKLFADSAFPKTEINWLIQHSYLDIKQRLADRGLSD